MELLLMLCAIGFLFWWREQKKRRRQTTLDALGGFASTGQRFVELNVTFNETTGYAVVRSPFLYAPAARSENGKYIAAFADQDMESNGFRGGYREEGDGLVLLGADGKVVWSRSLERPHKGGVSNDGHVAVEDWLFGGGRKGNFYVFSPEGKVLIRECLSANLSHSGIAPDASLAWCSTASSETSDSRQFAVFEVDPPSLLFKRDRLYGQPEQVMRTPEGLKVYTDRKVGYRLSAEGEVLNPVEVERQIEQHKGTDTSPNVPMRSAKDPALEQAHLG